MSHTWISQKLDDALHQLFLFLRENPSEFVLVQALADWEDRQNLRDAQVRDYIYQFSKKHSYTWPKIILDENTLMNTSVRSIRGSVVIQGTKASWFETDDVNALNANSDNKLSNDNNRLRNIGAVLTPQTTTIVIMCLLVLVILVSFCCLFGTTILRKKAFVFPLVITIIVGGITLSLLFLNHRRMYQEPTDIILDSPPPPCIINVDFYSREFVRKMISYNFQI